MNSQMPSTKTDFVYGRLKKDILGGKFRPGDRLRLAELAGLYKISEMPIREALRMLQHDGLVSFESHRGATVSELSIKEILEMISVRSYLEILAVSESVPHHNERTLRALDDLLTKMESTDDGSKFSELNHSFHRALYAPCVNQFLKSEIDDLWDRVWQRWPQTIFNLRSEQKAVARQDHKMIVEAIRSKSEKQTEKAMRLYRAKRIAAWQDVSNSLSA